MNKSKKLFSFFFLKKKKRIVQTGRLENLQAEIYNEPDTWTHGRDFFLPNLSLHRTELHADFTTTM